MALKSLHWLRSNSFSLGPLDFSGGIGISMGCIITEAIGIPIPPQISWGGRIPMWYRKSNGVLEFQWSHWNSNDGPYCHSEKRCLEDPHCTAACWRHLPSEGPVLCDSVESSPAAFIYLKKKNVNIFFNDHEFQRKNMFKDIVLNICKLLFGQALEPKNHLKVI